MTINITKERDFIHELSSPISTMHLILQQAASSGCSAADSAELQEALRLVEEAAAVLRERRAAIIYSTKG